jgi:hypothetical protein
MNSNGADHTATATARSRSGPSARATRMASPAIQVAIGIGIGAVLAYAIVGADYWLHQAAFLGLQIGRAWIGLMVLGAALGVLLAARIPVPILFGTSLSLTAAVVAFHVGIRPPFILRLTSTSTAYIITASLVTVSVIRSLKPDKTSVG